MAASQQELNALRERLEKVVSDAKVMFDQIRNEASSRTAALETAAASQDTKIDTMQRTIDTLKQTVDEQSAVIRKLVTGIKLRGQIRINGQLDRGDPDISHTVETTTVDCTKPQQMLKLLNNLAKDEYHIAIAQQYPRTHANFWRAVWIELYTKDGNFTILSSADEEAWSRWVLRCIEEGSECLEVMFRICIAKGPNTLKPLKTGGAFTGKGASMYDDCIPFF
ncbi:uncharacterized protein AB675_3733 [Cyphellophora attinorum]|uniref:Uncharacterized protein n=1 Tax=Cyphellophora attinorum TaxID=1664694 RepID=A0A0N1H296_9EURO|nr:uncharacterized protein AB675_3733 [Phialophora attinorum]KPI35266.1 hypothetical protein AB675_3733 [Phialophora attinorum]